MKEDKQEETGNGRLFSLPQLPARATYWVDFVLRFVDGPKLLVLVLHHGVLKDCLIKFSSRVSFRTLVPSDSVSLAR